MGKSATEGHRRSMDAPLKNIPPHSADAEMAVLGSILKDPKVIHDLIDFFNEPELFFIPKHQIIFRSILDLYEEGQTDIDSVILGDALTRSGELDKVGGRTYLVDLMAGVASTANAEHYAGIIQQKYQLRKLIYISQEIATSCYEYEDNPEKIIGEAEREIFEVAESGKRRPFIQVSALFADTFERFQKIKEDRKNIAGVFTGYGQVDRITNGLHDGDMIVIAGRPSMGKTAFAMNIAENIADVDDRAVGIFSLEMSKESLGARLLCSRAKVSGHRAEQGGIQDQDWDRLTRASATLNDIPIYIDDLGSLSTLQLRAKARQMKAKYDIGLIIIDYIQLLHVAGHRENRQQEMAHISRTIKGLAKELNIPILALCQLSRMTEIRGGEKRPQLSDLRESGAIEQDADVVMFVYRPEVYLQHLDKKDAKRIAAEGKAEIIIAKQRNGPTGIAKLAFVKEYSTFENLTYQEDMPF